MRLARVLTIVLCSGIGAAQSQHPAGNAASTIGAKPLLLEKYEGESRVRRAATATTFMLKVSPQNNDSQRLVLVEEDFAPGFLLPL
ncbi:MAG TPA: hypothetical protein VGF61_00685 [Candidatus Acidoferrum sp.]|jgi:hypothetical protein